MAPAGSRPSTDAISRGTWYLVPTLLDPSGEIDIASLRDLVDAAISWGVDRPDVMGVMSELAALADDERHAAVAAILDAARGGVPVIVGCSAITCNRALALIADAKDLGAVAAMVAAPTLLRNVDQLPDYYGSLRRDGGLLILLQDETAATGVTIPVSVLFACDEGRGDTVIEVEDPLTPPKIGRLMAVDPSLVLLGGLGGMMALSELRRGAAGTMTGFAYPEVMRAVRIGVEQDQLEEAAAIFDRFLPLIVFEAQPVVGLLLRKEVLHRRGVLRHAVHPGADQPHRRHDGRGARHDPRAGGRAPFAILPSRFPRRRPGTNDGRCRRSPSSRIDEAVNDDG